MSLPLIGAFALLCLASVSLADAKESGPFVDILKSPDRVKATTDAGSLDLTPAGSGEWSGDGLTVKTEREKDGLKIELRAPSVGVKRIELRWSGNLGAYRQLAGDAWERTYGDSVWRALDGNRVMPWFFLASDGSRTDGYGVMIQPNAFCSWKADADGISLTADVRCGGSGVKLGSRTLAVCVVTSRRGKAGESAFQAERAFAKKMCPKPRLSKERIYGYNDWYYTYGGSAPENLRRDARFVASLAPKGAGRPFVVVDYGWEGSGGNGASQWSGGCDRFPSMSGLASDIRAAGARAGIWIRPLLAVSDDPQAWRLSRDKDCLDPTVPAVKERIAEDIKRIRGWGYDLVKFDFTSYDLTGRWSFVMGDEVTNDGWAFADPSVTTAEVVNDLYATIRKAAGDDLVIACDTFSHMAAGIFEYQRIGDDTSGKEWDRTRKMGVNALAFRSALDGVFYGADPDCVGLTTAEAIPWTKNRQWMDLIARSGAPLFLSLNPDALTPDQIEEIKKALALAVRPQPAGEPLDWMENPFPKRWKLMGETVDYDW